MMMRLLLLALVPAFLFSTAHDGLMPSSVHAESAWDAKPDVPYVPTPHKVVDEMLRLADVQETDIIYDLGSGDGRIVISAVKDKGAKMGVGIDIDSRRIEESRRNASKAGVTDRVEFMQEDLFTVDFSDATVVTLYLLPDVNLRLRPKLFEQLEPGTRIVSHAFHMDEWEPDETTSVGPNVVYYWVLPANASGDWVWSAPGAQEEYRLQLTQHFQEVGGALQSGSASHLVNGGHLEGDRLMLTVDGGSEGPILIEGRVQGDVIEGTMSRIGGEELQWRAVREPDTMTRVDRRR